MIPKDAFAMIIGAMKSGTTTMYAYLSAHPGICPCAVKEPEYFSRYQNHATSVGRYEDLWEFDCSRHRYALEASTGYTKYPLEQGVPERIAEYGLKPRFIYVLRDPFERIESHYNSMQGNPKRRPIVDDHHVSVSDYYLQLQRYHSIFPRENILLLDFQQLIHDPAGVARRACSFLKLEDLQLVEVSLHENPTPYHSGGQRLYGRLIRKTGLRIPLPEPLKAFGRKLLGMVRPTSKRRLTTEERNLVRRKLAPGMLKLREEYGFDVEQWGFRSNE